MAGSEHLYLQPILADTVGDIGAAVDDIETAIQPIPGKIDDQILAMAGMVTALEEVETKLNTVNATLNNILLRVAAQAAPVAGNTGITYTVYANGATTIAKSDDTKLFASVISRVNGYVNITFKMKSSYRTYPIIYQYIDGALVKLKECDIGTSYTSVTLENVLVKTFEKTNFFILNTNYALSLDNTTDANRSFLTAKINETLDINEYLSLQTIRV